MDLILDLIGGVVHGLVWGAILLIVSIVLLPENIFRKVLRKLKPDLVSKNALMSRLRLVFDYLFNNKEIILEDPAAGASKALQQGVATLMREKRLLEGNLFFLDLLQNLSRMLMFSVLNAGYELSSVCSILDQSMDYLQYYARELKTSSTSQNIEERVYLAADRLKAQVNDTAHFLQEDASEEPLKIARMTMKQGTEIFDSFMKAEYQSTKENLLRTNQLLAEKFIAYVGEVP